MAYCYICRDTYSDQRAQLGYVTCPACGDKAAQAQAKQHCIVPMHKSNYVVVSDLTMLRMLNPNRTEG